MLPFLLPIILIIYGEFSGDINTRFVSRILFYTYTLSQLATLHVPPELTILSSMFIMLGGIGYCIVRCRTFLSRMCFSLSAFGILINSMSIYLKDYTLLLSIPYYADYSHIIIRESLIAGLGSFALWKRNKLKDESLTGVIILLMVMESLLFSEI